MDEAESNKAAKQDLVKILDTLKKWRHEDQASLTKKSDTTTN